MEVLTQMSACADGSWSPRNWTGARPASRHRGSEVGALAKAARV